MLLRLLCNGDVGPEVGPDVWRRMAGMVFAVLLVVALAPSTFSSWFLNVEDRPEMKNVYISIY